MNISNKFFGRKKQVFKIGDTVKCIDDRYWNGSNDKIELQYGKTYKVLDIVVCSCCGEQCLDVGGRFILPTTFTVCHHSKKEIQGRGIHWAGEYRFTKITEQQEEYSKEEIEKAMENAAKEEKYELAQELKYKLEKLNK
jgi:hypothetical protein